MKIAVQIWGMVLSSFLSIVLSSLNFPLPISIFVGILVLIMWIFACIIFNHTKAIEKEKNELTKIISQQNLKIEDLQKQCFPGDSCLTYRSTTAIVDFLREAKKDFYISGIVNNSVINTFLNNRELITKCCREGIKIHILFYVSDNELNFDWYLQMLYGKDMSSGKISIDKDTYRSGIDTINKYEIFKMLMNNNLLQIRRLDAPATTAFIARDIQDTHGGEIQCQFYQYRTDCPECPVCRLISSDEMYSSMREIILSMWNDASTVLDVDYIKK